MNQPLDCSAPISRRPITREQDRGDGEVAGDSLHAVEERVDLEASACDKSTPCEEQLRHTTYFYRHVEDLAESIAAFVAPALDSGAAALLILADDHRLAIEGRCRQRCADFDSAFRERRVVILSAESVLADIVVEDDRATERMEPLVIEFCRELGAAGNGDVHIAGEVVSLLMGRGSVAAALELERSCCVLGRGRSVAIHCSYPMELFGNSRDSQTFDLLCALHSEVRPADPRWHELDRTALLGQLARLDQRAQALQAEVMQRRAVEGALRESEDFLRRVLDSSPDSIKVLDQQGHIVQVNPAGCHHLDALDIDQIVGRPWSSFWPDNAAAEQAMATAREGEVSEFHAVRPTLTGIEKWWDVKVAPIPDECGENKRLLVIARDSTATRKMAQRLAYEATHDRLTGLVNRAGFEQVLQAALGTAEADHRLHALLYIDLDQFKIVNDTCGHVAGDRLLRQLSDELASKMRSSDTLARLGGDEFAVLLENCPPEDAQRIADVILAAVKGFRFSIDGNSFSVSASIGVVHITHRNCEFNAVLAAADAACYLAKAKGRDRISVYRAEDRELQARRQEMGWVTRIKDALQNNRLKLHRQAIVNLSEIGKSTGAVPRRDHYEVLLRIDGADGKPIPPMSFIPAAERYDLMPEVDRWVIRTTLEKLAASSDDADCWYAINISGTSLGDESFAAFVLQAIADSGVRPESLCFEITETAAINNFPQASQLIENLHNIGCRCALDDFGSGLSSFVYLKNLAVDYLKIDGAFIEDLGSERSSHVIVKAINDVAHGMGMKTIAEFVGDQCSIDRLQELGVDYIQGFHMHRPEPFD